MADSTKLTPEQLMALLESIIRDAPALEYEAPITEADLRWLGRAEALLDASRSTSDLVDFRVARSQLRTWHHSRDNLLGPLHNAYFKAELQAAPTSRGAFIPAGDTWNGYAALVKLVQRECCDLFVIDPYLNADFFTDFLPHANPGAAIRCLAVRRNEYHGGLVAAAHRWASDPVSSERRAEVRYAQSGSLHDRLIIIDSVEVWMISQSIKDIAKRSPASVSRADTEMAQMKVQHYNSLWDHSTAIHDV